MKSARYITPVLAMLLAWRPVQAQWPRPGQLPEPWLHDTPWGDFPLERVERGSRLRLTYADGRTVEAQVLALRDSTLELQSPEGTPLIALTFADLRTLRLVEVRAVPAWRERAARIGLLTGAVIGAIIGKARHREPTDPPRHGEHQPSLTEDVATHAGAGAFFGWMTGRLVFGRPRWRRVTVP